MSEKLELVITLDNGQFKVAANQSAEQIDKIKSKTKGMLDTLAGTSASVGSIAKLATVWGAVGVGIDLVVGALKAAVNAIGEWMSAGVKNASQMEQWTIGFEVLFKSADKAKSLMKDIKSLADKTPFAMPQLTAGAQRLAAFGIQQKNILPILQDLGNASQGDAEKLDRLTLAYGKVAGKGRVSMEELNMFIEAGAPIREELARSMGVPEKKLDSLIEAGKVGYSALDKALSNMTNRGGAFAGMLDKQGKSMKGLTSTLSDAWESLKTEFGIGLSEGLKEFIQSLSTALGTTGTLKDAARSLGKALGDAFKWAADKVLMLNVYMTKMYSLMSKLSMAQGGDLGALTTGTAKEARLEMGKAISSGDQMRAIKYAQLAATLQQEEEALAAYQNYKAGKGFGGGLKDTDLRDVGKGKDSQGGTGGAGKEFKLDKYYGTGLTAVIGKAEDRENELDKALANKAISQENYNKQKVENEKMANAEILQSTIDTYGQVTGVIGGALNQISDLHKQELDGRIQKMNFWANIAKAYINANVTDEAERERQIAQIDNAREIRELMMKRRAAMQEKQFKIASAIMNTFSGAAGAAQAMAGIPYVGPFLAIAAAAGMVALGMAQVRMIQATPLPLMETGAFDVPRTTPAIIHEGETVIPKNFTDSIKAGDISISGGDSNRTINLVVDGRTLATVVDNHRSKKAASMGALNYAYGGVYK